MEPTISPSLTQFLLSLDSGLSFKLWGTPMMDIGAVVYEPGGASSALVVRVRDTDTDTDSPLCAECECKAERASLQAVCDQLGAADWVCLDRCEEFSTLESLHPDCEFYVIEPEAVAT